MKLEISCNMIEGRKYKEKKGGIIKWEAGQLWKLDDGNRSVPIALSWYEGVEIELMPMAPDENTPQGTEVRVRDNDCHKWATGKFLCINTLDEHQRYVIWADKGCTMDYRYCEIIEED